MQKQLVVRTSNTTFEQEMVAGEKKKKRRNVGSHPSDPRTLTLRAPTLRARRRSGSCCSETSQGTHLPTIGLVKGLFLCAGEPTCHSCRRFHASTIARTCSGSPAGKRRFVIRIGRSSNSDLCPLFQRIFQSPPERSDHSSSSSGLASSDELCVSSQILDMDFEGSEW